MGRCLLELPNLLAKKRGSPEKSKDFPLCRTPEILGRVVLKGSRASCDAIILGIFGRIFGQKRSPHVMDASCRQKVIFYRRESSGGYMYGMAGGMELPFFLGSEFSNFGAWNWRKSLFLRYFQDLAANFGLRIIFFGRSKMVIPNATNPYPH